MKKTFLVLTVCLLLASPFIMAESHKSAIWGNVVKYKNSSEITITPGSGRCNDYFWENTSSIDLNLSSVLPAVEDFVYIYVDESASSFPTPTFVGSTTEPTWTEASTRIGWYNGNDRCIGVVWCDSYGNILDFQNNREFKYITTVGIIKQPLINGNPNSAWQTVETTAYIPINATAVYVQADNSDWDGGVFTRVAALENAHSKIQEFSHNNRATSIGWISLERGWSRDLAWIGWDDDDNYFTISILGFSYER